MAERIDEFSPRRLGRPPLYPWAEWVDGSTWRITRGEDFEVTAKSMVANLYSHAYRQGLSLEARQDGESIEFQFVAKAAA
jgi:hypothetical protein